MGCRKVRRVIWYHMPDILLYPQKYAHPFLPLFYPFREEKILISRCPPLYQNKLLESSAQTVVNSKKNNIQRHGDLVEKAYSHYNANINDNQDPFGLIEKNERWDPVYYNDKDDQNAVPSRISAIPSFMPRIMADDEILENFNSLNPSQCDVFIVFVNGQ